MWYSGTHDMVVSNHWTGILEWTTGLTIFWFYTFLRVGLLYIWVTCDNISALSGKCIKCSQMCPVKCTA